MTAKPHSPARPLLPPSPWRVPKPRPCLRCAKSFDSPHAGVRICPDCRRLEGYHA